VRPSVVHGELEPVELGRYGDHQLEGDPEPNLCAWGPLPLAADGGEPLDFLDGLHTLAGAGEPALRRGLSLHVYLANRSMQERAFTNADGDMLVLPDTGALAIRTELGWLKVAPGELAVIPRGLKFAVWLLEGSARGYVCEVYGRHFRLPERGPIGANGLADPRHFVAPVASYEDRATPGGTLVVKFGGRTYVAEQPTSPFDVVGWHGNYTPYTYDLERFNAMGTVTFDHPDPSIYTVLTAPGELPGENAADLVTFPARWDVATRTYRRPYPHRNAATEWNAIVKGPSRRGEPFTRGGLFLTPSHTAHAIDGRAHARQVSSTDAEADVPEWISSGSRWVQIETTYALRLSRFARQSPTRVPHFRRGPQASASFFDPTAIVATPRRGDAVDPAPPAAEPVPPGED